MTKPIYFDTDCISAFLWVNEVEILLTLYPGQIFVPQQVIDELKKVTCLHLRLSKYISSHTINSISIQSNTDTHVLYNQLTSAPQKGFSIIGKGEAAVIALALLNQGIVASNNLKDVKNYVSQYSLEHLTTAKILYTAYQKEILDEYQGNQIWATMIAKKRKLGYASFSDCILSNRD